MTTTGFPTPTPITETGALPAGVTFVDKGKCQKAFDAPCVSDIHFKEPLNFSPGTVRGFVLQSSIKTKYPDRYETIVSAFERAFKDPKAIASMEKQQLDSTWYGPDESNAVYQSMFTQYKKHADLLQGA